MTINPFTPAPPSAELLDRYFAGKCTPAESDRIRSWASQHTDGELALQTLYRLGQPDIALTRATDTGWAALAQRIDETRKPSPESRHLPQRSPISRWGYTVASCALGLLLLFTGWRVGTHSTPTPVSPSHGSLYTTGDGKQATVTLPDGSTVLLNVASRLEVPSNYEAGNRTLRLSGEALFQVTANPDAPFTVIAGPSVTRVLGTRFIVRRYETDTTATVAVQEGKVSVRSTVLTAREEIEVGPNGMSDVRRTSINRFRFERGVLTLDGVQLQDAIHDLNRWFGADVRLGDPALGTRILAGEYAAGSIGTLSEILRLTFDVRVVRNGRILTLYPRE